MSGAGAVSSVELPEGAVSVVNPKGTEETGSDRPAAPISKPHPRDTKCAGGYPHQGFHYCSVCGLDLTPGWTEQHGRYNDSEGAARSGL